MDRLKKQDFWAGAMFIAFGMLGFYLTSTLSIGTAGQMGSGYVPRMLSVILGALGVVIAVRSFFSDGFDIDLGEFRPVVFILGATVAFAALLTTAGLIPALIALVVLSALGGRDFTLSHVAILSIALALFCYFVFHLAIGMNFTMIRGGW